MKVNFDKIITSVVYQPKHPEKCKTDRDYELFAKYMIVIQVLKGRYMKGSSTLEEIKDMAESCDSREGLEEFYKTLFLAMTSIRIVSSDTQLPADYRRLS